METKPILDVACGGKMFYFDKNDERVHFNDIREVDTTLCDGRSFEISPDTMDDFTALNQPSNAYNLVVFDPPHLKAGVNGWQAIKYGRLDCDWRDMLRKGFAECFRVLKPGGVLILKWNETAIKVSEILSLTPEKPIIGHKSGKQSKTHWICFMKTQIVLEVAQ